jgi:hypothetical protein
MARLRKNESLKDFRHKVSELKRRGIIDAKTDVRKVTPNWMRGGKTLRELVDKFDPVTSDKAEVFPTEKVTDKGARTKYERVIQTDPKTGKKKEFLIVPKYANESITVQDGKIVRDNTDAGIRTMEMHVPYHKLEQFIRDSKTQKYAHEKGFKQFAFRFFGGYSRTYRSMKQLLEDFEEYRSVQEAMSGSPYAQRELFRNFELVEVKDSKTWFAQRDRTADERKKAKRAATKKTGKRRKK